MQNNNNNPTPRPYNRVEPIPNTGSSTIYAAVRRYPRKKQMPPQSMQKNPPMNNHVVILLFSYAASDQMITIRY